jgi:predicted kinase
MLVILAGLPGTGKSTLAAALAQATQGIVLNKDEFRARMYLPGEVAYSTEQDDRVMALLLDVAALLFRVRPDLYVFLDGRVFARNEQLGMCTRYATGLGQPWRVIECVCRPASARKRITGQAGSHPAANRTATFYDEIRARFEAIPEPKLVVDTDKALADCLKQALAYVSLQRAAG